jgi:hypothetical protein
VGRSRLQRYDRCMTYGWTSRRLPNSQEWRNRMTHDKTITTKSTLMVVAAIVIRQVALLAAFPRPYSKVLSFFCFRYRTFFMANPPVKKPGGSRTVCQPSQGYCVLFFWLRIFGADLRFSLDVSNRGDIGFEPTTIHPHSLISPQMGRIGDPE